VPSSKTELQPSNFPNGSTHTWPILNNNPTQPHQAFSTISGPPTNSGLDPDPDEQHFDDTTSSLDPDQNCFNTFLPLELISRQLAHRKFQNLMVGSLHQTWNDHVLSPTIDPNTWPFESPSAKSVPVTKHLNVKATNPSIAFTLTLCKILSAMV
jgi:hypothetical protein